jgi:hypothetical protein
MATQLLVPLAVAGIAVLSYLAVDAWTRRTAHLNLGLFRPYRRDPWPVGVQEDDDFRFQWTPAAAPAPLPRENRDDAGALGPAATIEDITAESGPLARVHARSTSAGDAFTRRGR